MEEQKLGLILGSGQGGEHEPALIILEHGSEKDGIPIAIVGKGVCFDTGGLNIKIQQMQDMRFDIPLVGPSTIEVMKKTKAKVLAIEAGRTLLIDREEFIGLADDAGISVVGI